MPAIPPNVLASLQSNTKNIRNICILAHVDHGKTTLSDSLISSNGIISQKLAGKVRYLDNRPDEIARRITMKSSCISLLYQDSSLLQEGADQTREAVREKSYLVNLIDSPGHVDFSSEVSTAVRVCDGALVLVDAVEGACIQTHAVLRQAWAEKVKPCLVINKIDRLITELHMTPLEAFERIKKVLEQVNAIVGSLFSQEWFKELDQTASAVASADEMTETVVDFEEKSDDELYFAPEKGNVVFASAYDGWAFRVDDFCELYSKKLGVRKETLRKTLWGEFYFNPKTKKIHQKNTSGKMTPMFVQFVLNNIWEVYNAAYHDKTKREKIAAALKLTIPPRDLTNDDPKVALQAIFCRWLPVADGILRMVLELLPNPIEAQAARISKLWQPSVGLGKFPEIESKQKELENSMKSCDSSPEQETVIFVSKVVSVSPDALPRPPTLPRSRNTEENSNTEKVTSPDVSPPATPSVNNNNNSNVARALARSTSDKFIGFARIFSGTIKRGQTVQILGPRYSPLEPNKHRSTFVINELYLLMGRSLENVDQVPAGNVFGIGGVEEHIIKTATISSTEFCPTFNLMTFVSSPIVRVAVEPENLIDMPKLVEGLKILNQADPCVEILVQETGEHVIIASGELHLERCLRDLRETFAKIPINVSPPLVAFRETVTNEASHRFQLSKEGVKTPNKLATIRIKAIPLPENIRKFLQGNSALIRRIFVDESMNLTENVDATTFRDSLCEEFKKAGGNWKNELEHLWAFGPRRVGPNILLNYIPEFCNNSKYWTSISKKMSADYKPKGKEKKKDGNSL